MSSERGALWDLDGVIVDSGPFHFRAWRRIAGLLGRDLAPEEFRASFGLRNEDILRRFFGISDPRRISELARRKEEFFREEIRGKIQPQPGAVELLRLFEDLGFAQALVSSTPRENIDLILSALEIRDFFSAIISGEDVRRGKPDPEGYLLAAQKLGIAPENCVVIEDAVAGVQAARAAGMKCIAVATTYPPEALKDADLVVQTLKEVNSGILKDLFGR